MLGEEWSPLAAAALEAMDFVPCPTQPGDALFFDCFAPHRSAPNLTNSQRRVLYVTYNRASEGDYRARYFADKRAALPPEIERAPGESHVFKV